MRRSELGELTPSLSRGRLVDRILAGFAGVILLGWLTSGGVRGQQSADAEARNKLGSALYDQGKLEEAVTEFRAAIRLKPDYAMAHYNLGVALKDQGKLQEAVAEFARPFGPIPGSLCAQ